MGSAASHHLWPPASSARPARRTAGVYFSFLLLVLALALLWTIRHTDLPFNQWFVALPFESPVDLALLFSAALAALFLHEFGHLLVSVLLGFELLGCSFGPLRMQMLHGVTKLWFNPRQFFTGSISAVPRGPVFWRPAMIVVIAAGPLATLAATVGAAHLPAENHWQFFLQSAFIQVSTLLFVLGLLPNPQDASTHNDARLLLNLLLRKQGSAEMELNLLLTQQVIGGRRPQDYPMDLVARLAAWRGRTESQLAFAQALVGWSLDSEEFELAAAWDLRALQLAEQCAPRLQNAALASSACLDVLYREDLESARNKFARVDFHALFPKCFEYRARAAQQLALGRLHRVPGNILRAQYKIPRGIPAYALDRALLANLHMKVLHASAAPKRTNYMSASV